MQDQRFYSLPGETMISLLTMKAFLLIISGLFLTCAILMSSTDSDQGDHYIIRSGKIPNLIGRCAYTKLSLHFEQHPELIDRLTSPTDLIPGQNWGYLDQYYPNKETMLHLMAKQIKTMIEMGEIKKWKQVFDPKYGIGSKNHKDKGTLNNVFSVFGHPVREIILQGSQVSTLTVYNLFRKSIKNELKAFARSRTVAWHFLKTNIKTKETMNYLLKNYPKKTNQIEADLKKIGLSLETLISRALNSNLLS